VVRQHALDRPDAPAYAFMPDGRRESARLTFAEVDTRARAIAAALQGSGLAGERVLVAYPSGLEYVTGFLACLYAGSVAVPCEPPGPAGGHARLDAIAGDARPAGALCTGETGGSLRALPGRDRLAVVDVAAVADEAAGDWREPALGADALAFLQYTSGSTRAPRGVVVTHGNLVANERSIARAFEHDADSTFVGWLPLFHDMGLVGNVLQPLFVGALSAIMPPVAFLRRPLRWLAAIERYRARTSGAPDFAYRLCVDRVPPEERAELDLSSWRVAFNGADVVRPDTVAAFAEAFAPAGFSARAFLPCYGLAEATLLVTGTPRGDLPVTRAVDAGALRRRRAAPPAGGQSQELAGSGTPAPGVVVRVVDPASRAPCPPGLLGEIWVAGDAVSPGYWDGHGGDAGVFGQRLAGGEGPYLRTGDLGFLDGGHLFVTGRLKDVVIVRGQNHSPHDLERTAEEAHAALRRSHGVAFQVGARGEDRLVLAYELERDASAREVATIARAVRAAIAERHGLAVRAVALVRRRGIARTTSGKVRRAWCRQAYEDGKLPLLAESVLDVAAPGHGVALPPAAELAALEARARLPAVRQALVELLAREAGIGVESVDPAGSLAALGLDSMSVTRLRHELESAYGVDPSPATAGAHDTVEHLARAVVARIAPATTTHDVTPAATGGGAMLPLRGLQPALWYEYEAAPGACAYNLTRALRIRGALDAAALQRAFDRLVARHPALRSAFRNDAEPRWYLPARRPVMVVVQADATDGGAGSARAQAVADEPFDLLGEPPVRAVLLRRGPLEHVLVLAIHHVVADFWSFVVALRDLEALYVEESGGARACLPALAEDGLGPLAPEPGAGRWDPEECWDYWRSQLAGPPPPLALPLDRPRPPVRTYRGAEVRFSVGEPPSAALARLATELGTTPFVVLLTAYGLLLQRHTGTQDVVVGTLAAGRERAASAELVGCLTQMLAIRLRGERQRGFDWHVRRTRETLAQALAHSALPLDRVVARLRPEREPGRPALVQTLFTLHKEYGEPRPGARALALGGEGGLAFAGLGCEVVPLRRNWAQLDLSLTMAERDGRLEGVWEYSTDLFDERTVAALARRFTRLLEAAGGARGDDAGALDLLPADDRARVLERSSGPARRSHPAGGVVGMIERQARLRPGATAVVAERAGGTEHVSYGALLRSAGALARLLGHGPERRVAVLLERGTALPVALLAILATGATYVPLDPEDPDTRLAELLRDARAGVVLTERALRHRLAGLGPAVHCVEDALTGAGPALEPAPWHPGAAAYLLFTSGSTGRPKGVVVPHGGLANRIAWMQERYGLLPGEGVLHKTPVTFDVSLWELLWPLAAGATVVVARPGAQRDPGHLARVVASHGVGTLHFVPSMLAAFLDVAGPDRLQSLRTVISSGEALPAALVERFEARSGARLHNLYGPTEASIDVTAADRPRDRHGNVTIGRPITGVRCYVLDRDLGLVPERVTGELCIGGVALARGYDGRPGATAERFRPDPHTQSPGARLYRTGDRAHRRHDGQLAYAGREDDQVKVAGNRVEPAEVADAIRRLPGVRDAAVAKDGGGRERLVAYVVADAGADVSGGHVRERLRASLPGYLVPAAVVVVDALPLTPAGKLDRRALPPVSVREDAVPLGPRTEAERRLLGAWEDVLRPAAPLGVHDDFYAAGGDSIRAIQVVARARAGGDDLSVTDLLRYPTVAALAARADRGPAGTPPAGDDTVAPFALCAAIERDRLPADAEDAYPITIAQRALLFHAAHSEHYEVYVSCLQVRARFDGGALRACVEALATRHAYLRSSFDLAARPEPLQVVHRDARLPVAVEDLRALGEADRAAALAAWVDAERARRFDVARGPLARVGIHRLTGADFQLSLTSFALDGWCVATALTELIRDYRAALGGERPRDRPAGCTFADFVALERRALASAEVRGFWHGYVDGAPPTLVTAPAGSVGADPPVTRRRSLRLDASTSAALRELAGALGVPLKSLLLAAHLAVVAELAGRDDVVTGLEVNGRPERDGGERVIGVFNNIVPLHAGVGDATWAELARRAAAAEAGVLAHRRYPYAQLDRERGLARLFDTLFVYTHFRLYEDVRALDGVEALRGWAPDQTYVPLTAHFNVDAWDSSLKLLVDFDPRRVTGPRVIAIVQRYHDALARLLADPGARALAEPRGCTVHGLLRRAAERYPDRVAVSCAGEHTSYRALHERAGALAALLRARGVGPETVVGLYAHRGAGMVVGLLAILAAGGAYLPLDPDDPPERASAIAGGAGVGVVVVPAGAVPPPLDAEVVRAGDEPAAGAAPPGDRDPAGHPGMLAYVIATSGSTGAPKLVAVEHRALARYLRWCLRAYGIDAGTRSAVQSSLAFDLTVTSLLAPLAAGGTVELLPQGARVEDLGDVAGRCTLLKLTPLHLDALGRQLSSSGREPRAATTIVVGGEALDGAHLAAWAPWSERVTVVNEYGPTEATVGCCTERVRALDVAGEVAIGRAARGARLAVDPTAPEGAGTGELLVGGDGLARGYLGAAAATAERFEPDPGAAEPGARRYRTGDAVHRDAAGRLYFRGRLDRQVNVRGRRVEPGEVEAALRSHPGVGQAAVVARRDRGRVRLVAFWVASGPPADDLERWLAARLPAPLLPERLVAVPALPSTANGKVDYAALARVAGTAAEIEPAAEPAGAGPADLARRLADIWQGVLERDGVGPDDDFFELGGDSIHAIVVVARAQRDGIAFTTHDLFERRTPRRLAAAAETVDAPGPAEPHGIEEGLTPLQEGMLYHSLRDPASTAYVVQVTCTLRGDLDVGVFRRAWQLLVDRHPVLRTTFHWPEGEAPRRAVAPAARVEVSVLDSSGAAPGEQGHRFERLVAEDRARGVDLGRAPLLRVTVVRERDQRSRLLWTHHHVVLDGWSQQLLLAELLETYAALRRGDVPAAARRRSQGEVLAGSLDAGEAARAWRGWLAGARPTIVGRAADPAATPDGRAVTLRPAPGTGERLQAFARAHGVTPGTLWQAGWAIVLSALTGRSDVVYGLTVSGRPAGVDGATEALGMFAGTVPLRCRVATAEPFGAWLRGLQERQAALHRLAHTPLAQIERAAGLAGRPLFDTILVVENFPALLGPASALAGLEIADADAWVVEDYPLVVEVSRDDRLRARYDPRRLAPETATACVAALARYAEHVAGGAVGAFAALAGTVAATLDDERSAIVAARRSGAAGKLASARRRPAGTPAPEAAGDG
jgi:nonribosomal peptide synthetase protein BlmVI